MQAVSCGSILAFICVYIATARESDLESAGGTVNRRLDDPRALTTSAFSSTRISAASSYHKDDPEGPLPRRGAPLSVHIQLRTPSNAVRWHWRRPSSRLSPLQLAAAGAHHSIKVYGGGVVEVRAMHDSGALAQQ